MFAASKTSTATSGYQISRSLRFNSADTAYLNRTPASASNRKTWTWSGWVKRGELGTSQYFLSAYTAVSDAGFFGIRFVDTSNFIQITGGITPWRTTTQVFRDPSAWYHIVLVLDTTQATADNRVRLYINGVEVTDFGVKNNPSQNADLGLNGNWAHSISSNTLTPNQFFNGYMTEVNFIDGQALTPSSFGETNAQTGVWSPIAYSGSYGTNGFYLNFSDNSNTTAATLGADYSGNGNNWTPNNFSVTAGAGNDSLVDSPTSYGTDTGVGGTVRGNYCTLNPLIGSTATLSNGNLNMVVGTTATKVLATIGMSSGKWYWEYSYTDISGDGICGIATAQASITAHVGLDAYSWGYVAGTGNKVTNSSSSAYGASYTTNDVIGVAFDADAGTLVFYKNGTSQGTAYSSLTSGPYFPAFGDNAAGSSSSLNTNFGQRPFAYTAPSGFKALCTQNLPTPTIGATTATQAGKYFGVTLRTGGAPSGGTYTTTVDMSNGALLWDKARNQAQNNYLVDSNRGLTKFLQSNATSAESTQASWYTSFGNGTYSTGSSDWGSSVSLVDWIWAAGANTTNTAGTITSTVSANTTSGFSVVTFTGTGANATIGHGLGVAPRMVIVKSRTVVQSWIVYHASLGNTSAVLLNSNATSDTNSVYWNNTSPTSTVFSLGTNTATNQNGSSNVAYCFAEVAGYSKFGSFTGNGSADGPFVYTGFRPAYVMVKKTNSTSDWLLTDDVRSPSNVVNKELNANLSLAEGSGFSFFDYLSNGFKSRGTNPAWNTNGDTYIYMAFASAPFKFSLAR